MSNKGHRLGEVLKVGQENTLKRLNANWNFQFSLPSWRYTEFDVVETRDHNLIVFHDRNFKKFKNKKKVKDLNLSEIKNLYPFIPTLDELFKEISLLHNIDYRKNPKPIRVEIKRLNTDLGRDRFVETVSNFKKSHWTNYDVDITCIAFKSHFKKSFPKKSREVWTSKFLRAGLDILNVKPKNKKKMHHVSLFTGESIYGSKNWKDKLCEWF